MACEVIPFHDSLNSDVGRILSHPGSPPCKNRECCPQQRRCGSAESGEKASPHCANELSEKYEGDLS